MKDLNKRFLIMRFRSRIRRWIMYYKRKQIYPLLPPSPPLSRYQNGRLFGLFAGYPLY